MVKRFKQFNSNDKFTWRKGDIEHHRADESLVEYTHDQPKQKETHFSPDTSPEGESHRNQDSVDSFKAHHKTLKDSHMKAIDDYKTSSSSFNHYMRHHKLRNTSTDAQLQKDGLSPAKIAAHRADEKETINHYHKSAKLLDHVTSHKIEHHHTVFRSGVPGDEKTFPVGHKFTDHGYTGTSFHEHVAGGFANQKSAISHDHPTYKKTYNRKRIVHVIHISPGTKGHYLNVDKDVPLPREKELLLHRGTKFKVTHHTEGGDYHYIHSRVIGQHPRKLPNEEGGGGEAKSKSPSAATQHGLKIHFTPDQQAMIDKWHEKKAAK